MKVRFAPSPTGFLHIGGLRTALFNFLFANKYAGKFLLRIEDTDRERLVAGSEEDIKSSLKFFGLIWEEEYKQSERLEKYKFYAGKLISEKRAYLEKTEIGTGVRFRMNTQGQTRLNDLVHGEVVFENEIFKDPILLKSDGYPVYNFANVIDDYEMKISHVVRGEEFLSSTPIHIQIYEALGWTPPRFIHLPLILDPERKKLSKRTGDVAVKEYIEKGYLPEALINFIALLGWNPKTEEEIFSLQNLVEKFSVEKINKSGAIFDISKLDYINRCWQEKLNLGENDPMYQRAMQMFFKKSPSKSESSHFEEKDFSAIWPLIHERIKGPSDLEEKLPEFEFFSAKNLEYEPTLLIWKQTPASQIKANLGAVLELISNESILADVQKKILGLLEEKGIGKGESLWPLRVALSGQQNSPGPFEIIDILSRLPGGRKIILERLQEAIEKLDKI